MSGHTGNAIALSFNERHAPKGFNDLVFADSRVQQRLALYAGNLLHRSIVLHGPYGTAKSVTAMTIVHERRQQYGLLGPYVHRYSGAWLGMNFGALLGSVNLMLVSEPAPFPYVIIDEADQLPKARQQELRDLLSTVPSLRVILTTNSIAAIDGGVRSRCECISMLPATPLDWLPRAQAILADEGVSLPNQVLLQLLVTTSDVRDLLGELEALVVQHRIARPPGPTTQPAVPPTTQAPVSMSITMPTLTVVPGNALVTSGSWTGGSAPALTILSPVTGSGKTTP